MNKYCQSVCKYTELCYLYMTHQKKKRKQGWKEKIRKSTYHKVVTNQNQSAYSM